MADRNAQSVAIVTGGAEGIGRAVAVEMTRLGHTVAIVDRNEAAAYECVELITQAGGAAHAILADLSDRAACARLAERIAPLGPVRVLVNNAGVTRAASLADTDWPLWDDHFSVNLDASFACAKMFAPMIAKAGWGRIVFVSSHSALRGSSRRAAYAATKAGQLGLMRVLAVELARDAITVNAVAPGPVETPHVARTHTRERRDAWAAAMPIKRYVTPDEVAAAVAFFAHERAGMITGQTLAVDGGFTIAGLLTDA